MDFKCEVMCKEILTIIDHVFDVNPRTLNEGIIERFQDVFQLTMQKIDEIIEQNGMSE